MSDIFLSYSSEDRPTVQVLAGVLQAEGLSVWYDLGLGGDVPYHEQIAKQLELASVVVACWSDHSHRSRWVYSEADAADKLGKLVNVRLDSALPPQPFDRLNAHDLSGWSGNISDARYIALIEDVRRARSLRAGLDPGARALPTEMPATRAWLHIHNSVEPTDYRKFLQRHPTAPQRRLAEEHLSNLDSFAEIDLEDAAALHDFLISGPFEALGELAKSLIAELKKKPWQEAERRAQEHEFPKIRKWLRVYWVTGPLAIATLVGFMGAFLSSSMQALQRPSEYNPWLTGALLVAMIVVLLVLLIGPFLMLLRSVRSEALGLYFDRMFNRRDTDDSPPRE